MSDEPSQAPRRLDWNPAAGWSTAITRAVIAFVVVLAVCGGTAFLLSEAVEDDPSAAPPPGQLSTIDTAKVGGIYFALAHRTAVVADADLPGTGGFLPERVDAKMAVALLGFSALAAFLLFRGGRAVADAAGASGLSGGLHGAKIAVPYALLSLALSFVSSFEFRDEGASATLHPSYLGAILWPFAIAAAAGFVGGVRAGDAIRGEGPAWWSRLAAALSGGWRMLLLGLLFAYLGLQVTAFARTGENIPFSPGYFEQLSEVTPLQAASSTEHIVLTIPNQAVWVLVPAMGACDSLSASLGLTLKVDFLCYAHFPDRPQEQATPIGGGPFGEGVAPRLGSAPPINFLFLLVPLVATVLGGRWAARRVGAGTSREGVVVAATAGVGFAALVALAIVLARVTVEVSGAGQGGQLGGGATAQIGPELLLGTLFALAWGVAGGALGGWLATRGLAARPEPSPEATSTTQQLPPG